MSIALTPPEHEHTAGVSEAASWLATMPAHQRTGPVVPALRQRFGLTPLEAVFAIREASMIRERSP